VQNKIPMDNEIEKVHGDADATETIQLFYYKTKEWEKEQGYSVFSLPYRAIIGQGRTKEEAFDDWIKIMHLYNEENRR